MNKRIGLLGGILAVQALILAVLLVARGIGADEEAAELLSFEPARTASLEIATADEAVKLLRGDEGWQLEGGLPADDGKVGDVLEKIAKVSAAWPVATSVASAERFEVTEDNFQRRLDIESEGGETATLYLGSSPGYRRVHARADGADEVYSIDFSNYEAPVDADQWLDKTLLRPSGKVLGVSRESGWKLSLAEVDTAGIDAPSAAQGSDSEADTDSGGSADAIGGLVDGGAKSADGSDWMVDGTPADDEAAKRMVGRFADLSVLGIAETQGDLKGSFTVEDTDGEYRLDLFFDEEGDDYSVVSSRVDGRFEIATYIAEQMLIDTDELLPGPEAAEGEDESENGE